MLLVVSFIFILILRFDESLKLIRYPRSRQTRHDSQKNVEFTSVYKCNSVVYPRGQSRSKINAAKPSSPSEALSPPKPDDHNNADRTRGSLVRIIEDSWSRVSQLIPESTLILCEEELKGATSLLVLATVRRAADESAISRATVEGMFREADVNHDGLLTFQEWFQWLGAAPASKSPSLSGVNQGTQDKLSQEEVSMQGQPERAPDPMIEALSLVLSNAVCTLKTTSRITQDPSVLAAAFVAGGTMAGVLDATVCDTMLSRLSPKTREMVTKSLSLESDSLPSSFRAIARPLPLPAASNRLIGGVSGSATRLPGRGGSKGRQSGGQVTEPLQGFSTGSFGGFNEDKREERKEEEASLLRDKRSKLRAARSAALSATDTSGPVYGASGSSTTAVGANVSAGVGGFGVRGPGGHVRGRAVGTAGGGGNILSMSSELLSSLKIARGRDGDAISGRIRLKPKVKEQSRNMDEEVVQTVDLSFVPVLVAPPIEDRLDGAAAVTFTAAADVFSPSPSASSTRQDRKRDRDRDRGRERDIEGDSGSYSTEEFFYSEFDLSRVVTEEESEDARLVLERSVEMDGLDEVLEGSIEEVEYSNIRYDGKNKKTRQKKVDEKERKASEEKEKKSIKGKGEIIQERSSDYFLPKNENGNENQIEAVLRDTVGPGLSLPSDENENAARDRDIDARVTRNSKSRVRVPESMLSAADEMANEFSALRADLGDLDDAHALIMRQLLLSKGEGRTDVLGLAMALRSTRLQHAARFPISVKQQLAIETMQLWVPLSYQVGMSAQIPELEIHSYVLLFPGSFGTFVTWYGQFRPAAKALLKSFRSNLTKRLERDSVMPALSDGVTIQSRLKTPPSAFKKMIKSAKRRQQLHDMIGMRIIISEKNNLAGGDCADQNQNNVSVPPGCKNSEEAAVWRVYSIVCSSLTSGAKETGTGGVGGSDWVEDKSRFKDYVTAPKPSGYQSLHMTLQHKESGIKMEVQIRSQRMHWEAEYGAAAHTKYKALMLP